MEVWLLFGVPFNTLDVTSFFLLFFANRLSFGGVCVVVDARLPRRKGLGTMFGAEVVFDAGLGL